MLIVEVNRELKTLVALIFFCLFIMKEIEKNSQGITPRNCRKSAKNIRKNSRLFWIFNLIFK